MVLASCVCDADNYIYHIDIQMVSLKQVQQLARLALVIFFETISWVRDPLL
jgi:hypothetical protein